MLNQLLPNLKKQIAAWAQELKKTRWISKKDHDYLLGQEINGAHALFNTEERPLVVGFFGGTGVGKSSLLNRLSGESIARTGVERPTSREVTIYLHRSISIDHLPKNLPTHSVKTVLHNNPDNRDVMWVDMPDFDSIEEANKELVLKWLPYIDVLIYVVTPERYKDDLGWRLLLKHGLEHAWLFVLNHWDRGVEVQLKDFENLLNQAGLKEPVILKTDCRTDRTELVTDNFDKLESTIQQLANNNIIKHLEQRGVHLQIQALHSRTKEIITKIGSSSSLDQLVDKWQEIWAETGLDIVNTQRFQIDLIAEKFANKELQWLRSAIRAIKGNSADEETKKVNRPYTDPAEIWDEQVRLLVKNSLDQLVQYANLHNIPTPPLNKAIKPIRNSHRTIFALNLQKSLQSALSVPGSYLHRLGHQIAGYATTVLPILAIGWVVQRVLIGFYDSAFNGQNYLGFNFAIHSGLLIGLAWLLPYFVHQKSKPSLQEAATEGMRTATSLTLIEFDSRVLETLETLKRSQRIAISKSEKLFSSGVQSDYYSMTTQKKVLTRMLMKTDNSKAPVE